MNSPWGGKALSCDLSDNWATEQQPPTGPRHAVTVPGSAPVLPGNSREAAGEVRPLAFPSSPPHPPVTLLPLSLQAVPRCQRCSGFHFGLYHHRHRRVQSGEYSGPRSSARGCNGGGEEERALQPQPHQQHPPIATRVPGLPVTTAGH